MLFPSSFLTSISPTPPNSHLPNHQGRICRPPRPQREPRTAQILPKLLNLPIRYLSHWHELTVPKHLLPPTDPYFTFCLPSEPKVSRLPPNPVQRCSGPSPRQYSSLAMVSCAVTKTVEACAWDYGGKLLDLRFVLVPVAKWAFLLKLRVNPPSLFSHPFHFTALVACGHKMRNGAKKSRSKV